MRHQPTRISSMALLRNQHAATGSMTKKPLKHLKSLTHPPFSPFLSFSTDFFLDKKRPFDSCICKLLKISRARDSKHLWIPRMLWSSRAQVCPAEEAHRHSKGWLPLQAIPHMLRIINKKQKHTSFLQAAIYPHVYKLIFTDVTRKRQTWCNCREEYKGNYKH